MHVTGQICLFLIDLWVTTSWRYWLKDWNMTVIKRYRRRHWCCAATVSHHRYLITHLPSNYHSLAYSLSQGATAIADLVVNNDTLKFLSLEWNQIGSIGAVAIAKSLEKNETLTHLDLRNNNISGTIILLNSYLLTTYLLAFRWRRYCTSKQFNE